MTVELGLWALVFVRAVCLVSGFAHGALGFGFPMVATPLAALVLDIKSAIVLLAPLTMASAHGSARAGCSLRRPSLSSWCSRS